MKEELVNIAPTSTEGHFLKGAKNVIDLDSVTESFYVEGKSEMKTKNHTTLTQDEDVVVSCQVAYNPFTEMYENSRD